jgi:hypothetical protein
MALLAVTCVLHSPVQNTEKIDRLEHELITYFDGSPTYFSLQRSPTVFSWVLLGANGDPEVVQGYLCAQPVVAKVTLQIGELRILEMTGQLLASNLFQTGRYHRDKDFAF